MIGLLGCVCLLGLAIFFSENRKAIAYKSAVRTFALQVFIAVLALMTPIGSVILETLSRAVMSGIGYANVGIEFMFGPLSDPSNGMVLAFQVLPVIIFIASILSILFYYGVMDGVIRFLGGGLRFLTGASRLEATCAAANVFIGMVESPLTILPYLKKITRSQLFVLMALGLSSVAGTVLFAYAALGIRIDLLLTAAFMAAPGGLLMGRLLVPETQTPYDPLAAGSDESGANTSRGAQNVIEAATTGALTGLQIMLSVIAVLIAFIAIIALLNGVLGTIGGWFGFPTLSFELLMGYIFAPFAFLMGVPWEEAQQAGVYLGQKVVLNEFLAYANFAPNIESFSAQGQVVITIALCGFANFGGLAILLAGLTTVIPERRSEISELGLKTLLAGTLSNFMSAAIVSVVYSLSVII